MIQRPVYLKKFIYWKDKQLIKVVSGVRRSGKSTLFKLFQEYLLKSGVPKGRIISLNMEDPDYSELLSWKKLYDYINSRLAAGGKNYVFIDEVQNVADFQRAADGLFIKDNVDLYLTGSNASLQSGQWATMLTGRYIEIHLLPLSFKEYVSAYPFNDTKETMYQRYLETGSFPYVTNLRGKQGFDGTAIREYLAGIYNTIVMRDVVENKKIRDVGRLDRVMKFMTDNVANITSAKRISDILTGDGIKVHPQTVEGYMDAFCDSYILYRADRYDIKGTNILKTLNKYYIVDAGLLRYLLGNKASDRGKILENIVYLELLRRGNKIFVGKADYYDSGAGSLKSKEIDFVTDGANGREYYQVAETVRDKTTLEREISALQTIRDHNPKILLTMDADPQTAYNGIRQINVLDWLLYEW
jgi:predicted AAA+ superfamily ATPase